MAIEVVAHEKLMPRAQVSNYFTSIPERIFKHDYHIFIWRDEVILSISVWLNGRELILFLMGKGGGELNKKFFFSKLKTLPIGLIGRLTHRN